MATAVGLVLALAGVLAVTSHRAPGLLFGGATPHDGLVHVAWDRRMFHADAEAGTRGPRDETRLLAIRLGPTGANAGEPSRPAPAPGVSPPVALAAEPGPTEQPASEPATAEQSASGSTDSEALVSEAVPPEAPPVEPAVAVSANVAAADTPAPVRQDKALGTVVESPATEQPHAGEIATRAVAAPVTPATSGPVANAAEEAAGSVASAAFPTEAPSPDLAPTADAAPAADPAAPVTEAAAQPPADVDPSPAPLTVASLPAPALSAVPEQSPDAEGLAGATSDPGTPTTPDPVVNAPVVPSVLEDEPIDPAAAAPAVAPAVPQARPARSPSAMARKPDAHAKSPVALAKANAARVAAKKKAQAARAARVAKLARAKAAATARATAQANPLMRLFGAK